MQVSNGAHVEPKVIASQPLTPLAEDVGSPVAKDVLQRTIEASSQPQVQNENASTGLAPQHTKGDATSIATATGEGKGTSSEGKGLGKGKGAGDGKGKGPGDGKGKGKGDGKGKGPGDGKGKGKGKGPGDGKGKGAGDGKGQIATKGKGKGSPAKSLQGGRGGYTIEPSPSPRDGTARATVEPDDEPRGAVNTQLQTDGNEQPSAAPGSHSRAPAVGTRQPSADSHSNRMQPHRTSSQTDLLASLSGSSTPRTGYSSCGSVVIPHSSSGSTMQSGSVSRNRESPPVTEVYLVPSGQLGTSVHDAAGPMEARPVMMAPATHNLVSPRDRLDASHDKVCAMSGHCLRHSIPDTNTSIPGAVIPPLREPRPCQNKSRCCFPNFWNHVPLCPFTTPSPLVRTTLGAVSVNVWSSSVVYVDMEHGREIIRQKLMGSQ